MGGAETGLAAVRARLEQACAHARRDPAEVRLIAVTKGQSVAVIQGVLAHGQTVLGESRVQEWRAKAEALGGAGPEVEWHLIGSLQTNKVRYCRPFHTLHSLNSERLADALEAFAERHDHRFRVLVEVNVGGEANKQGVSLQDAPALVRYAQGLPHLEVAGLMTIAPYADPEVVRPMFKDLRKLRDTLALRELSMGMSGDFEVAAEEGATYVRVGSALFAREQEAR
jgi:PLP dependent protein